MDNLKKFNNEAEYSAATLSYPAVSWIVSGDTVKYDLSGSTPLPTDIVMAWNALVTATGQDFVLWNMGATDHWSGLTGMTLNDVEIEDAEFTYVLTNQSVTSGETIIVKYGIDEEYYDYTHVSECLTGDLGGGWGSDSGFVDFYLPSRYVDIEYLPSNVNNLVIAATTPPTLSGDLTIGLDIHGYIYVPDDAVDTYKADSQWGSFSSIIYPISDYQGSLPV